MEQKMEIKQMLEQELGISFSFMDKNNFYQGKYENCTINVYHTGTLQVQGKEPKRTEVQNKINLLLGKESICQTQPKDYRLFIVYGHDKAAREQLERICEQLNIKAEKVTNQSGKLIMEALEGKIEKISAGIVLLTPDDYAGLKEDYDNKGSDGLHMQARQNVILEMGMLMGKLGRDKVIILQKEGVQIPSDIQGLFVLRFKNHVQDTTPKLAKKLEELGFNIDYKKVVNLMDS